MTPRYWPEVRRGTERAVHELGAGLAARGHQPTVITSRRGFRSVTREDGIRVVRLPRAPGLPLRRLGLEEHVTHVPLSYLALRAGTYDVAHAWYVTDAVAALRWRRPGSRPVVCSYMGIPDEAGLAEARGRRAITRRAVAGCDAVVALSRHAAGAFRRTLDYDARVIPPPVDTATFGLGSERTAEPTIVCAADPLEPRKRLDLLVAAFGRVRAEWPGARLVLDATAQFAQHAGVELVDMSDSRALARLYGSAWVS